MEFAASMFRTILDNPPREYEEARNRIIFRQVLSYCALFTVWSAQGGIHSAREKTLKNDIIDSSHAAYASFFDGVLTNDSKLREVYKIAIGLLGITDRDYVPG